MEKGNCIGFISKKLPYNMLKTVCKKKFFKRIGRPFLANLNSKIKKITLLFTVNINHKK
jgi:hypothetical protein